MQQKYTVPTVFAEFDNRLAENFTEHCAAGPTRLTLIYQIYHGSPSWKRKIS